MDLGPNEKDDVIIRFLDSKKVMDDTEANLQKLYVITSSVDPEKAETEEQQDHYRKCR